MLKGMCYLRNKVEQPQLDRIWGSSAFPQFRDSTKEGEKKWDGAESGEEKLVQNGTQPSQPCRQNLIVCQWI